ncbi:MAG TPA: hypothetical protein VG733_05345 [Chthoniobacteraceae bacterium]|nr:hypothetical protein [Chthoniobacteraceae bacterium]
MAELLRACARKRKEQAGAPFELHPATRSMLQAEVARLVPRMKERRRKALFIPRLVFGAAAFASIAICAFILLRPQPSAQRLAGVSVNGRPSNAVLTSGEPGHGLLVAPSGDGLQVPAAGAPIASPTPGAPFNLAGNTTVSVAPLTDAVMEPAALGNFNSSVASNSVGGATTYGVATIAGSSNDAGGNGQIMLDGNAATIGSMATAQHPATLTAGGLVTFSGAITTANSGSLITNKGGLDLDKLSGTTVATANALTITGASTLTNGVIAMNGGSGSGSLQLSNNTISNSNAVLAPVPPAAPALTLENRDSNMFFNGGGNLSIGGAGAVTLKPSDTAYITSKLEHIIIPSVEFHDVNLSDAIAYLQKESADLDTDEKAADRKGINVVIKAPVFARAGVQGADAPGSVAHEIQTTSSFSGATVIDAGTLAVNGPPADKQISAPVASAAPPAPMAVPPAAAMPAAADAASPVPTEAKVTVSLKNVTLASALRSVAASAGFKVQVNTDEIVFVPQADVPLVAKEYAVPDGFLDNNVQLAGNTTNDARDENRNIEQLHVTRAVPVAATAEGEAANARAKLTTLDYLRQAGVPFPPGASAELAPSTGKLMVRNTKDNLELVDKVVDASIDSELARETAEAKKLAIAHTMQVVSGKVGGPDFVLSAFQVQVQGNVIYIIDADGSIYSGTIEQPLLQKVMTASNGSVFSNVLANPSQPGQLQAMTLNNSSTLNSSNNIQMPPQEQRNLQQQGNNFTAGVANGSNGSNFAEAAQQDQLRQNFSFRAAGINRLLKTPVVFNGSYIAAPNPAKEMETQQGQGGEEAAGGGRGGALRSGGLGGMAEEKALSPDAAKSSKDLPAAKRSELIDYDNNARIEGQAQVGEHGTVDVNAIVVPPASGKKGK